jgi:methyltransferase family protein
MVTAEERRYLRWLTAVYWREQGHVLEIGPWLGGSTACLAQGLEDRGSRSRFRVHTVDNFVWRRFMSDRADLPLAEGESFEAAFSSNVAPWADRIVAWRRSLPDDEAPLDSLAAEIRDSGDSLQPLFRWLAAEPIEILFIDGAKTWAGMIHLLEETVDHLVPSALLVCQDYKYWENYWVPLLIEMLMSDREVAGTPRLRIEHVLPANTVSFTVAGRIERSAVEALPRDVASLGAAAGTALLDRAADRLRRAGDLHGACVVSVGKVRMLANLGWWDAADDAFRVAQSQWPIGAPALDLERARGWLADNGRRVESSPSYRRRRLLSAGIDFGRRVRHRLAGAW